MKITHLNPLRALEATLRNCSFRAAAKELAVTPAAVSQRIATLENYIGHKLFIRAPTGVEPTEFATKHRQALTHSFLSLSQILEDLQEHQSQKRIALSMTDTFAAGWLLPRLNKFYLAGTEIDFRINTTDRVIDLANENIDYGIRFSLPENEAQFNDIFCLRDTPSPCAQ